VGQNNNQLSPELLDGAESDDSVLRGPLQPLGVSPTLYHYAITRSDIPRGLQAAQLIHAAGESARLAASLPPGTHAIALEVHNEAALAALGCALDAARITHTKIYENDLPYDGQLMGIGIAPLPRSPQLKRLLGGVKLLT